MTFKFGGSGGGGGAGDTYTASTAVAGIPVTNGRSYNLSNEGKLAPANTLIVQNGTDPVPNSVTGSGGSGMDYSCNVYGDRITPDGLATFHLITDSAGAGYRGIFYVSLDGGNSSNGTEHGQNSYGPMMYQGGYGGPSQCTAYIKLLFEDDDRWYYSVWFTWKYAASSSQWYNSGHGFMLYKSNHEFTHSNWYGYMPQYAAMSTSAGNRYNPRYHYARQSKYFFETCRNKDIFVWTYGQYDDDNGGFMVKATDTYRSSDAAYYGGTNMGLPKTTGAQTSGTTHRDNAKEQSHMPFFKVDDTNGIFIAPYYATAGSNQNENVYVKYTIAANHTISETEIAISGTDPAQGGTGQGHWVATTNPLIFYYLYMGSTTALYYTKCTWNSDWTSATWGTQAYIALVGTTQANGYGATYWALDQDHPSIQCKHSVPEKELFFLTGANEAKDTSAVCSFPATGTPSFVGLTSLNNQLSSVVGTNMIMQSMNGGSMMSIQYPDNQETYGFACYYTDHFNASFKKTTELIAIARADGNSGDTVNIDLKTGDTSSATLTTDFYLTKEGMSYPFDVEGVVTGVSTVKSVQRGSYTHSSQGAHATVTIQKVDPDKSFLTVQKHRDYTGTYTGGVLPSGRITGPSSIKFSRGGITTSAYVYWEVIEYV